MFENRIWEEYAIFGALRRSRTESTSAHLIAAASISTYYRTGVDFGNLIGGYAVPIVTPPR
jgi:hypothetical protein